MNSERTFLGIDPGTTLIGVGVVKDTSSRLSCIHYGTIENKGKQKLLDYKDTAAAIEALVKKYKPQAVGIEKLFFATNQKTAMAVSEMRGVIMLALAHLHVPVHEFTPLQVKQRITNYGKADKKQVQRMVQMLLGMDKPAQPDDAADALALAICCAVDIPTF